MLACMCTAADADVIGASINDRAIRIESMARRRFRAMGPY